MCLAIPTEITAIGEDGKATVELGGVERQISLRMTPEASVGDYVLIHAGYALNVLDPEEAQATLEIFEEMAEIERQMEREEAAAE